MDMPEKLELIAKSLRDGLDIQLLNTPQAIWVTYRMFEYDKITVYKTSEYRAKPEKPRTAFVEWTDGAGRRFAYEAIELTPEVRKALEDAGIEI